MQKAFTFNLVIIGSGPGGYVAAIRAAQLGLKVAIVEREHLGGICLNWGCIPTKALLRSAEIYYLTNQAEEFGIKFQGVTVDFEKLVARSRAISKQLTEGVKHLLKKNNVTVFIGFGSLVGKKKVKVQSNSETFELEAKNIIIATGASAKTLPNLEPDNKLIWSYKEAMLPAVLPGSVLVVGSGAIGIEFASFYHMLGAQTTVAEITGRILNTEDEEIANLAHKAFEKRGMKILVNTQLKNLKKLKDSVEVELEVLGKAIKQEFFRIISAVGVVPNIQNIGLEQTQVKLENGYIKTNSYMETDEPGIYAIGDVTAPPWLAHKASHEGVICAEKIAGADPKPMDGHNIPGCIYSYPQIASIGYTEEQARSKGHAVKVGKFPFIGNGKAIALGETGGMVKTIFDSKTGELLGAHIIGAEVTEMIQGFGLVKTLEGTEQDIMHNIFPHPTLSEMIGEATLAAFGKALHI